MSSKGKLGYVVLGAVVSSVVTAGGIFMLAKKPVELDFTNIRQGIQSITLVQPGNNRVRHSSDDEQSAKNEIERICERRWKTNFKMRGFCISRMEARR